MKLKPRILLIPLLSILALLAGVGIIAANNANDPALNAMESKNNPPEPVDTSQWTEEDWKKHLSPEQYQILRQAGTERPWGEIYEEFKNQKEGAYYCAGCGQKLFSTDQKFDSHCGWPSFWNPAEVDKVDTRDDHSMGRVRTEVICSNCGGHLGHVFEGEGFDTPTDQRYCINGAVLVYVPAKNPE